MRTKKKKETLAKTSHFSLNDMFIFFLFLFFFSIQYLFKSIQIFTSFLILH